MTKQHFMHDTRMQSLDVVKDFTCAASIANHYAWINAKGPTLIMAQIKLLIKDLIML